MDMTEGLAKATLWGANAVGCCYLAGFIVASLFDGPVVLLAGILVGMFAWIVAMIIVGLGMIVIALPLTWLLRRCDCEDAVVYGMAGALAGFTLPLLPDFLRHGAIDNPMLLFAFTGLVAGGTAGFVWGRWREEAADEAEEARKPVAYDRGERWLR